MDKSDEGYDNNHLNPNNQIINKTVKLSKKVAIQKTKPYIMKCFFL